MMTTTPRAPQPRASPPLPRRLLAATERIVAAPSTTWQPRDGYVVRRTPERPDFWFGNLLEFATPTTPSNLAGRLAVWDEEFGGSPAVRKRILRCESTSFGVAELDALAVSGHAHGLDLEVDEVFVLDDLRPARAAIPLDVRPVAAVEWDAVERMATADGRDGDEHGDFSRWQWSVYRDLVRAGRGLWWAGWSQGRVVTTAGLFRLGAVARFQHVQTRADARGRGCASALLSTMLITQLGVGPPRLSTRAAGPAISAVIVAERGSPAARIYSRLGFRSVAAVADMVGDPPLRSA